MGLACGDAERRQGVCEADAGQRVPLAQAGRPLPAIDSLLAATASQHGLILVTLNLRDVQGLGVQILGPWDE